MARLGPALHALPESLQESLRESLQDCRSLQLQWRFLQVLQDGSLHWPAVTRCNDASLQRCRSLQDASLQ